MHRASRLLIVLLIAACSEPPGGSLAVGLGDHPVPGGQWGESPADRYPSLEEALALEGCRAYGGVEVITSVDDPLFPGIQGGVGLAPDGRPFIFVARSMLGSPEEMLQFLYFHECAHHRLQHPARTAVGEELDPVLIEYEANCAAATWLMARGLWGRQEIDFVLLTLENSRGLERPPGQAGQLVACLEGQGLY